MNKDESGQEAPEVDERKKIGALQSLD